MAGQRDIGWQVGIVFETASPFDTPGRIAELGAWCDTAARLGTLHPLIAIGIFAVAFLELSLVGLDMLVQDLGRKSCCSGRGTRTLQLGLGADDDGDLMRFDGFGDALGDKDGNRADGLGGRLEAGDGRGVTIEDRDGAASVVDVAVDIGCLRTKKAVRLASDLMRNAIVDLKGSGAASDVDCQASTRSVLSERRKPRPEV